VAAKDGSPMPDVRASEVPAPQRRPPESAGPLITGRRDEMSSDFVTIRVQEVAS